MLQKTGLAIATVLALCALGVTATTAHDRRSAKSATATQTAPAKAHVNGDKTRVRYSPGAQPRMILPNGEQKTIESLLRIDAPMTFGGYVWNVDDVPPAPVWVRVDIRRQLISVFRGGHEIGSAVILYGAESKPTPSGAFPVLQKAQDYHSRSYDAPMPFMLRLTEDGVAIHASNVRAGWATHGCIGVPEEFARHLFAEMKVGDRVFIVA
jgi:lipoprotein-anchoring transpeptidase ErfK/SrfK